MWSLLLVVVWIIQWYFFLNFWKKDKKLFFMIIGAWFIVTSILLWGILFSINESLNDIYFLTLLIVIATLFSITILSSLIFPQQFVPRKNAGTMMTATFCCFFIAYDSWSVYFMFLHLLSLFCLLYEYTSHATVSKRRQYFFYILILITDLSILSYFIHDLYFRVNNTPQLELLPSMYWFWKFLYVTAVNIGLFSSLFPLHFFAKNKSEYTIVKNMRERIFLSVVWNYDDLLVWKQYLLLILTGLISISCLFLTEYINLFFACQISVLVGYSLSLKFWKKDLSYQRYNDAL